MVTSGVPSCIGLGMGRIDEAASQLVLSSLQPVCVEGTFAAALGRAEPNIKHQVSAAMFKLRVQSRRQLIVRLLR